MIAWMPLRILAFALGLATLGSAALLVETASKAQPPSPDVPKGQQIPKNVPKMAPKPFPEAGHGPVRDEQSVLAREDVTSLETYVKAKKSQLREAEFRLQVRRANLDNIDRQLKKGVTSAYVRLLGELSVVAAEADRETRSAELKDVEIRRDRATRRLALIERGAVPNEVGMNLPPAGERLTILERETNRLRYEMDRIDKGL